MKVKFRILILFVATLNVLWWTGPFFSFYSKETIEILGINGFGGNFDIYQASSLIYLFGYLLAVAGCLLYVRFSRELYVIVFFFSLLSYVYSGISVLAEPDMMALMFLCFCDGFLVALMYFSRISEIFSLRVK